MTVGEAPRCDASAIPERSYTVVIPSAAAIAVIPSGARNPLEWHELRDSGHPRILPDQGLLRCAQDDLMGEPAA
jgi:hypothetical protein